MVYVLQFTILAFLQNIKSRNKKMESIPLFLLSIAYSSHRLKLNSITNLSDRLEESLKEERCRNILLEEALEKEKELRLVERRGRTSLQQEKRKQQAEKDETSGFSFLPIAIAKTVIISAA